MLKLLIGSVAGGIVQWFVGFLFWGTPLSRIAFSVATEAQNADVQAALARNLSALGAGTYFIPWPDTPNGTVMLGRGPVAQIMFNPAGSTLMSMPSLVTGLIFSIVTIFLIGLALHLIAPRVADFSSRLRVLALFAVATTLYFILAQPVFNFYMPWPYWIFLAVSDLVGIMAGGLVLIRWFLPRDTSTLH